jgi:hypothetical protein
MEAQPTQAEPTGAEATEMGLPEAGPTEAQSTGEPTEMAPTEAEPTCPAPFPSHHPGGRLPHRPPPSNTSCHCFQLQLQVLVVSAFPPKAIAFGGRQHVANSPSTISFRCTPRTPSTRWPRLICRKQTVACLYQAFSARITRALPAVPLTQSSLAPCGMWCCANQILPSTIGQPVDRYGMTSIDMA